MPSSNGHVWGPPIGPGSPQKTAKKAAFVEPRYQIVALCFFATFTAYVERVGFSIAYTEMAKAANVDEAVKGGVLSAFFWGYGLSQVCLSSPAAADCLCGGSLKFCCESGGLLACICMNTISTLIKAVRR